MAPQSFGGKSETPQSGGARFVHGLAAFALTLLMIISIGPTQAATTGTGSASAVLGGFVEISVTDGTIAAFSVTPSSSDPGPRAYSTADGFAFSNAFTNTRSLFSMDITSATDSSASSTKTVQGATHTIADWIYILQGTQTHFTTYEVTGTYDATAASYTTPGGFTKDSQGTFTIRSYDKTTPADGGDATTTVNWIYDSGANQYYFDATDKDFTNANGEALVNPSSKLDQATGYTHTIAGNTYSVTSVAGSGSNYVPTVRLGWQVDYDTAGSVTRNAYLLVDFPSGTPTDTYSITLTTSIAQLTS